MSGIVVVDSNLLVLLVVGSASRDYIARHKRLGDYSGDDFDLLGLLISEFAEMVLLPHVLTEASNLARQIDGPARRDVTACFATLVSSCFEYPVRSVDGVSRPEHATLGLADAVILHLCGLELDGLRPTLLTSDTPLADRASAAGYSIIDYRREFLSS